MDDFFADLIPARSPGNATKTHASDATNAHQIPKQVVDEEVSTSGVLCTLSREELQVLLTDTVQASVDATFGKFVRSLRTVLEDMGKRIDSNVQLYSELKGSLDDLKDVLTGQAENANSRFTSLDMAIKEVERGVQAMRDKQELHEAHALLAKFSEPLPTVEKKPVVAEQKAAAPAAAQTSVQAAPAEAAPAPVAAAPSTAVPAQPAAAPPTVQIPEATAMAMQPASGFAAMPVPAAAPPASAPVQYQPGYQPQAAMPQQLGQQLPSQYAPAPGQQAGFPYRVPDSPSGMPAAPPPQGPAGGPYQGMPGSQQQQQQQPQHMQMMPPQQQQQQLPQQQPGPQPRMGPGYAPQQFSQPTPAYGPQRPALMQGAPLPHMGGSMQGMPPSGPMYPQPSMPSYPAPDLGRSNSYRQPTMQAGHEPGGPPPQSKTSSRAVPLDQIITDITNMGFPRHHVMSLVNSMQQNGQAVDLNVILDRLTRGDY